MLNSNLSKKISVTVLCFAVLMTNFLFSSEKAFESQYAHKIVRCSSGINPPSILSDLWVVNHIIYFDNGLYGVKTSSWQHESQAKQVAKLEFSGNVNIVLYDKRFEMVFEERDSSTLIELAMNFSHIFGRQPRIKSITENIETTKHWFSKLYKYRYVIELNDSTSFVTKPQNVPKEILWEIGSQVIKVGNSKNLSLINMDIIYGDAPYIKSEHYLNNLEIL